VPWGPEFRPGYRHDPAFLSVSLDSPAVYLWPRLSPFQRRLAALSHVKSHRVLEGNGISWSGDSFAELEVGV
jgi:hypothetical protein